MAFEDRYESLERPSSAEMGAIGVLFWAPCSLAVHLLGEILLVGWVLGDLVAARIGFLAARLMGSNADDSAAGTLRAPRALVLSLHRKDHRGILGPSGAKPRARSSTTGLDGTLSATEIADPYWRNRRLREPTHSRPSGNHQVRQHLGVRHRDDGSPTMSATARSSASGRWARRRALEVLTRGAPFIGELYTKVTKLPLARPRSPADIDRLHKRLGHLLQRPFKPQVFCKFSS